MNKVPRTRLKPNEHVWLIGQREPDRHIYKIVVISDIHGILVDKKAFSCFLNLFDYKQFDEVVINGDVLDLPYLSRHVRKLYESPDSPLYNYSEIWEIEFTKRNILAPIAQKAKGAKLVFRLGNHDERLIRPKSYSKEQMERILQLQQHYKTVSLAEMLELKQMGWIYDPSPVRSYFDIFDIRLTLF